jgi:hypothetical protein
MGDGASATVGGVSPTVGDSDEGGPEQLGKDHVMAEQGQTMADAAAGGSPAERPGVCECFLCVRVRRSRACVLCARVCARACACARACCMYGVCVCVCVCVADCRHRRRSEADCWGGERDCVGLAREPTRRPRRRRSRPHGARLDAAPTAKRH